MKKRRQESYNEQTSARMFALMKQLVNRETLAKTEQKGYEDETPVFILGMPRSGTSLMEQILSSHPDIYGAGELKYMSAALENIEIAGRRIRLGDIEGAFAYDLNASYAQRGKWYVDTLKRLAPKPYKRIVDKMPGNFNFVGLIHAILPKARIIHSRRHPVETCLSCYRILFSEGQIWSYHLAELGRYYRRYWDLMQHWRTEFPGVMYEVRYEDIVADVEGQARRLIAYLGLEWNDSCLEFYNTDRPVKTASASQVKKPIYTSSVNRWRKYEKYLTPLLEELGDIVDQYEAEIAHLSLPSKT
ncbi:MAG: sulfotransferase [Methylohalobius sp.]|nr:sulfotransferase [Methylohalobius sp.]